MTWVRTSLARVVLMALGGGLVALVVCVSIGPVADWTQEAGACWGADSVQRDVRQGPTIQARPNSASGGYVSTTTFALSCRFGQEVRYVENDEAVLKGFLVSFLVGALPCAGFALLRSLRGLRRYRTPA